MDKGRREILAADDQAAVYRSGIARDWRGCARLAGPIAFLNGSTPTEPTTTLSFNGSSVHHYAWNLSRA